MSSNDVFIDKTFDSSFTEAMLNQKPGIEMLENNSFKLNTSAGILSFSIIQGKKKVEYHCSLEPGENEITKRIKANQAIWEDHKTWNGLAEKWDLDPVTWKNFRLECKKLSIEQKKQATEKKELVAEDSEMMKKITERALDILQHRDPLKFMVDTVGEGHLGDKEMIKLLFLCKGAQRVRNSRGLHPKFNGESSMGKSDLAEQCLHVLDKSCYIKGSASPKALFYHPIPDGQIIFMDDYKSNEDLDTIIKQTTSNFHEPYIHLTVNDNQGLALQTPREIVWCITSVDGLQDIQVLNRQFSCDVNDSQDLTKSVIKNIFAKAKDATDRFPINENVLICREMSKILQTQKFFVAVPYAEDIEWSDFSSRRNPSIFLDLIFAHTAWRFMQRERDEKGNLIATVQDFEEAKELYTARAGAMLDKLTDKQRELAKLIIKHNSQIFRDEAAKEMKISPERIRQLALGRPNSNGNLVGGMIQKLPEFSYQNVVVDEEINGKRVGTKKAILKLTDNEGTGWAQLINVVKLKNQEQWSTTTHYKHTTSPSTTPATDSCEDTTSITTLIEEERDEKNPALFEGGLNKENKFSLSQGQKEGCNACSGLTDADPGACSGACSALVEGLVVPDAAGPGACSALTEGLTEKRRHSNELIL
jgi:predicted DNA binding protein